MNPETRRAPRGGAEAEEKLLSTLGLCARARQLVMGTPMICEAMRASSGDRPRTGGKSPVLAVVEASDTSSNTHEKLLSKCTYYRVPHYRISADTQRLAHAVGKTGAVAAVAVTDENLLRALARYLPEASREPQTTANSINPID